jgi:hypothetical protein
MTHQLGTENATLDERLKIVGGILHSVRVSAVIWVRTTVNFQSFHSQILVNSQSIYIHFTVKSQSTAGLSTQDNSRE